MIMETESGWSVNLIEQRLQAGSDYSELLSGMSDDQGRVIHAALEWAIYSNLFQPYGITVEECSKFRKIANELLEELNTIFGDEE